MQRRRIYYSLVLLAWLIPLYSSIATANVIEQVIVVLDGEPYTLSNFKDYAQTRMGRDFPAGDLNRLGKEDQEVLEQFITEKLMAAEVKLAGIKITEADVDQYISQIKEKNRIGDAQLVEALRREGVTLEKYRASIRAEIEKSEIIDNQVRKRINITPEDVERYYRLNQKKYVSDERVRLRHILLSVPEQAAPEVEKTVMEKAAEIRRRALAGEDFAKLAESSSEGAGASEGGDIGWMTRGSLLKEIDEIAFSKLSVGEVSQPVRTRAGVHLIKLEGRDGGKQIALADVKDKITEELYTKALEERFQKWLKGDLRRKHRVDVKLPGVVFRPEDTKEGTMDSLVASGQRSNRKEESSFWEFLNPFKKTRIEDEEDGKESQFAGQNVLSLFGVPLFRSESPDDMDASADLLAPIEDAKGPADKPQESGGFFSSMWNTLNPFSKNP